MLCPNCGAQVSDNSKFCPNCGSNLAVAPAPQAAPVQETQPAATPQPVWKPDPAVNQQAYQQPWQQQDYQQAYQQQPYQQQPYQQQPYQQQPYQQQAYQQQPYQQQDYQQAYQPSAVPVEAKKRSGKKGILIGAGCLLLAALIGGGIWFLSRGRGQDKLIRAAANSLAELKQYTESLPNLHRIVENAEAFQDSGTMHAEYKSMSSYSYSWGENDTYSYESGLSLRADTDMEAKTVRVEGSYAVGETEIPFTVYLDQNQLQASSSMLLDEGEVLSLPLKDLASQWNASALSEMTQIKLPENLDPNKYANADIEAALEKLYGEDWTTFKNSIESVKYEGVSPFEGEGTTYTLSWDKDALRRMVDKTGDLDNLFDLDIDEPEDLSGIDFSEFAAKAVVAILGEAVEYVEAPLFYVEDNVLVGLRITEKAEEPMEITVRLLGEENPWEHLTVTVHENFGSYTTDDVVDVKLTKTGSQLRIEANYRYEDSSGPQYTEEEGPYALIYNDADGRITVEAEGENADEFMELFLVPIDGGFRFSMNENMDSDYYASSTEMVYAVSNKIGKIAPLSANPTEILKLTQEELQDLMERIQEKVNESDSDYD